MMDGKIMQPANRVAGLEEELKKSMQELVDLKARS
jgi:hypothetical protein